MDRWFLIVEYLIFIKYLLNKIQNLQNICIYHKLTIVLANLLSNTNTNQQSIRS